MSNLPELAQLEFNEEEITEPAQPTVHATYAWDFAKGDFILKDGKLVRLTGLDYVKVWAQKALLTVKDSLIYKGTDYGSEHHTLIGRNFKPSFTDAEYERMIREALVVNDAILSVGAFSFSQRGSRLVISFEVVSIYGNTSQQMEV